MASDLSRQLEELEYDPDAVDAFTLANMWTSSNDARGYAVLGDPAVRLRLGDGGQVGGEGKTREALTLSSPSRPDSAPLRQAEPPAPAETAFGLFGRGDKADKAPDDGSVAPGVFQSFVGKIVGTLSKVIEDAMTLEVRTYVSSDAGAAAGADRDTLARDGDLRAFTRIMLDGDTDVIVPERDGTVDTQLWTLHIELVKQAQAHRAEMIKTLLSSISGLTKP
jgi:hypothetical protein